MRAETIKILHLLTVFLLLGLLFISNGGCRTHLPASKIPDASAGNLDDVISHWDSPLHPSGSPASQVAVQQFQAIQGQSRPSLYSSRPFHEVELPLFFSGEYPYVQASWSGQKIACLVDIGTGTIQWPQWLHLDKRQLNLSRTQQWPEGVTTRTEWMLTARITVGDAPAYLELVDVPTEAIGFAKPRPSTLFPMNITYPILGMEAFLPFVLTIDYRAKRLILRDSDYDVTRQPHSAHSALVPYKMDHYGRVLLPGTLAGHKATFLLDTGSVGIYVTSSVAQQYFAFTPSEANFETGPTPALHDLLFTLNGLPFRAQNIYIIKRPSGPDVALGSPFFLRYRVTIDRFKKMVLLERNNGQ